MLQLTAEGRYNELESKAANSHCEERFNWLSNSKESYGLVLFDLT